MLVRADLHFHSVLSACADAENTVCNLAGMCAVNGVRIAALADHNAVANGRAFSRACAEYGICAVPAAEITTGEEIHVLCLFKNFTTAETLCREIYARLPRFAVDKDIYNEQKVLNERDEITATEPYLLSVACSMGIYELFDRVRALGGVAVPAHIDRESYSVVSVLGSVPEDLGVTAVEFSLEADKKIIEKYKEKYNVIISSDAHNLETLCKNDFCTDVSEISVAGLLKSLGRKDD